MLKKNGSEIELLKKKLLEQGRRLKKLEDENKRLHQLQNTINLFPASIYWKDKNGVYLGCNEYQLKMAGLSSPKEMIGKTDFDMPWKDIAETLLATDLRVIRGKDAVIAEESPKLISGNIIQMISKKAPLKDSKGNIVGVFGVSIDISEYRKSDIETRMYLETLLKNLPGIVYWKDSEGTYLGCNTNLLSIMGFESKSYLIGKTDYDLWPQAQADGLRANDERAMASKQPTCFEETITVQGDGTRYFTAVKTPLKDINGKIIGVMGNSTDITELKKTQLALAEEKERSESANKAKSEFISNMEHDLRTPTSGIFSLADMLITKTTEPEVKESLELIKNSSYELLKLINEVLSFSRIGHGFPIVEEKFSLEKMLDSVVKLEQSSGKSKNVQLIVHYAANIPHFVISDAFRLNRILINLVGNAVKFTHQGSVTLSVNVAKNISPQEMILQLIVEDTGIGIPREKQFIIFEKFNKGTLSNTGGYKGVGIGLRVAKQFVEELGGDIELESEMGVGTKFICYIPVKIPILDQEK